MTGRLASAVLCIFIIVSANSVQAQSYLNKEQFDAPPVTSKVNKRTKQQLQSRNSNTNSPFNQSEDIRSPKVRMPIDEPSGLRFNERRIAIEKTIAKEEQKDATGRLYDGVSEGSKVEQQIKRALDTDRKRRCEGGGCSSDASQSGDAPKSPSPCKPGRANDPCKPRSKIVGPGLLGGDAGFGAQGPSAAGMAGGGAVGAGGTGASMFRGGSGSNMMAPPVGGGLR